MYLITNYKIDSTIEQDVHVEFQNKNEFSIGPYNVVQWEKNNWEYSFEEYSFINEEKTEAVLFQGFAWLDRERLNASSFYNILKEYDFQLEKLREEILGEYSVVFVSENQVVSFNDNLGVENVYFSDQGEGFVLTNRMSLVKHCVGFKAEYDLEGMLWMPAIGNTYNEHTLFKELKVLPQGASFTFDRRVIIKNNPFFFFKNKADKPNRELLLKGLDQAMRYLENIFANTDEIKFGITGGMDSRFVLALLLNTKLKDKIKLFTNGPKELADVKVGKLIADKIGFEHTNPAFSVNSAEFTPEDIIRKIRIHSYQMDATFGAWDLKAHEVAGEGMRLAGFMGEALKGFGKTQFSFSDTPRLEDFVNAQGLFDPLEILKPEFRQKLSEEGYNRNKFYLTSNCNLSDIPDIYWLKERNMNWLGNARRTDSYMSQTISPLHSQKLIDFSYSLTAKQRQSNLVQFMALTELAPELLDIPFASQKWSEDLKEFGAQDEIFKDPIENDPMAPGNMPWQFMLNKNPEFKKIVYSHFKNIDSVVWDYFDKKKLLNRIVEGEIPGKGLISIYALLSMIYKVEGYDLPYRIKLPKTESNGLEMLPVHAGKSIDNIKIDNVVFIMSTKEKINIYKEKVKGKISSYKQKVKNKIKILLRK